MVNGVQAVDISDVCDVLTYFGIIDTQSSQCSLIPVSHFKVAESRWTWQFTQSGLLPEAFHS